MALTGGAAILAKLRAQRAAASTAAGTPSPDVLVIYASQTGTGQEIAKSIQADAAKHGIANAKVMSMNECGVEALTATPRPVVIVVASSTGDGDPPDNAAKAFVQLRRKTNPPDMLRGLRFTVLGLGDSNYTRFMYVPRAIKTRLGELGGSAFYECAEADEVEGLEEAVDAWVAGLWDALRAVTASDAGANGANGHAAANGGLQAVPPPRVRLTYLEGGPREHEGGPTSDALAHRDAAGKYSTEAPFWARVVDARYLTAPAAGKRVVHMALRIAGSGMAYKPGDSIGIAVRNDEALVNGLLQRLGAEGGRVFAVEAADGAAGGGRLLAHLQWPCTLRHALTVGVDLTSPPRKSLLQLLAAHCSSDTDAAALRTLATSREAYATLLCTRPTLLQLLQRHPSCAPPLDVLLDALPALAPRMYSIACAPEGDCAQQVQVAFSVVESSDAQDGTVRRGVATGYLETLCSTLLGAHASNGSASIDNEAAAAGPLLPIHHRSGGAFAPPSDLSVPWIMVGPGTGVAPFRGFLQARRAMLQSGAESEATRGAAAPAWLFFGCRREDEDYLYRQDLEQFARDGTLSQLLVAFSRAGPSKVYVQHLMRKHAAALFALLEEDAYVFVCGDGAGMAKDVHATLVEIIKAEGGVEAAEAEEQLSAMAKAGRYVRDIWS